MVTLDSCFKGGIATLKCVPLIFQNIIDAFIVFGGAVAVLYLVLSGIKFITSGGDQIKVAEAKKSMTFAVVGLLIVLLAFFVIKVLTKILGADCQIFGVKC